VIPNDFFESINKASYVKKTVSFKKPLEINVYKLTEWHDYLQNPQFENNSFVKKMKTRIKNNTFTLEELEDMNPFLIGSSIDYFYDIILQFSAVQKSAAGEDHEFIQGFDKYLYFLGRNNNNEISFERLIIPTKLSDDNEEVIFHYLNKALFTLQKNNLNADSFSINSFFDRDNKNATTDYVIDMIKDNQKASSKEFIDYDPENLYCVSTTGYLEKSSEESKLKFFCPHGIYHYDKNRKEIIEININMKFSISTKNEILQK